MLKSARWRMTWLLAMAAACASACQVEPRTPPPVGVTGSAAERDPDGKAMVNGCIWYYAASGGECHTEDVLAFCSDGRICVRSGKSNDAWQCVWFSEH